MGLNGKSSRNKSSLVVDKGNGNDDGKLKRRPFKVGPYRASSAVESWNGNGNKAPLPKSNRLTRSQSVESGGGGISSKVNKRTGSKSSSSALQELVVSPRKIWTTVSQKRESNSSSHNMSHPIGHSRSGANLSQVENPPTSSTPKKRRPFSFSRGFDAQDSVSRSGDGDEDELDVQNYDQMETPSGQELGGRSPRVHFAEPLQLQIPEDRVKKMKSKKKLVKSESDRTHAQEVASNRGRSVSLDLPQFLDGEKPLETPVKVVQSQSQFQASNPSPSDQLRVQMSQTDDLLMDVGNFVTDFTSTRKNFPVSLNFSYSPRVSQEEVENVRKQTKGNLNRTFTMPNNNTSMESVEGLSNIQCPSIVMLESARSNLFSPNQSFSAQERAVISGMISESLRGGGGGSISSRPTSASSTFFRSVSSDDIHGRIALTLKMIEQDELQRESMKFSSIPDKLETIENLASGNNGMNWSNNNPNFAYPTSLASTSVSEIGTRPGSSQSIVHTINNPIATLQQRSQFENSFTQQRSESSTQSSTQISPQPRPEYSQPHSIQSPNNNGNVRGDSFMNKILVDNFIFPQPKPTESQTNDVGSETGRSFVHPQTHSPSETCNEKTKKLFSFLDEAEKADRDTLLGLSSHSNTNTAGGSAIDPGNHSATNKSRSCNQSQTGKTGNNLPFLQKIDSLVRKGSVELAKEQIILERKFEESLQRISVLEETLIHQRELNMRNLRNSEKDLKKRLRLQKEEFDLAFVRNEALINEMVAEKRALQERCDKVMKTFDETEEKYKDQIKSLQQKHLDEIKRLRKSQITSESVKKQQWMGSKTQEIREMTVKGLEPEVQRIIQRHQQEMTEMRAWHTDELRETEERCQRKLHMQIQDMREKVSAEAEDIITREKEQFTSRFEASLKERESEFEQIRRRLVKELQEERERSSREEAKLKETMQENVRKAQIKGEVELENLKQEHETKLASIERRHINEINSLKDIHQAESKTLVNKMNKQFEATLKDKENDVVSDMKAQMENEVRDREKRLKEEFEKTRREEDATSDNRFKRMQEKFTSDLQEMDQAEKDLKSKFNQAKSQLLLVEEQVYSLKTTLSMKEKQCSELQEANLKMLEERAHLTSVIRREFSTQIENLESEVRGMRNSLIEIQSKHKLELEQKSSENGRILQEKDAEIDTIGVRVQHTIARKDETIQGLQKQLEKLNFQVEHLEGLLEEQRKNLVDSMTKSTTNGAKRK